MYLAINTSMKVKLLVSIASDQFSYAPGQVVELDDELAKRWVKSDICQVVAEPKKDDKEIFVPASKTKGQIVKS